MDWESFFTVHQDLPREGPGSDEDVEWACALAEVAPEAVICDAGSGPGGDIAALLSCAPIGRVVAVDKYFGDAADRRYASDPRVRGVKADFADLNQLAEAPFDMIWSAGALYFLGLENALASMARALKPNGVLAFSEPCRLVNDPSPEAVAFFEGYPMRTGTEIAEFARQAGYDVLGQRAVSDAGWEAYYQPMEARIKTLRPKADNALSEILDLCAKEAADWRTYKSEVGYMLTVLRSAS